MDQTGIFQRSIDFIHSRRNQPNDIVLEYIKKQKKLEKVIQIACLSTDENGKRHRHQNRINLKNLRKFHNHVKSQLNKIRKNKEFDKLIEIIGNKKIEGIGDLTIYDAAQRIGMFLNILPDKIYLHCGTKKGAKSFFR